MAKEVFDGFRNNGCCHPSRYLSTNFKLQHIFHIKGVLARGNQSGTENVRFRPRVSGSLWQEVVVPVLHFRAPYNCRSRARIILNATHGELFTRCNAHRSLCLAVSNSKSGAISILAKSHANIGRIQVYNGILFFDLSNLRIPFTPLLQIHNIMCKSSSTTGSLHTGTESHYRSPQALEIVNFINLVNQLFFVRFDIGPFQSRRIIGICFFKSTCSSLDCRFCQGRYLLYSVKQFIKVGKLNFDSFQLGWSCLLHGALFLKHRAAEGVHRCRHHRQERHQAGTLHHCHSSFSALSSWHIKYLYVSL
mmetsp:Transcript_23462/g.42318  ORF Transcript_23462/g.42318 Transcript_23462/m.42318 type:complete len:306 (+) Transcript_23462:316-1233(+)